MNAQEWLAMNSSSPHVALIGAPISRASISPSEAWSTPPAFRAALHRFPLWDAAHEIDISRLQIQDLGDIEDDRNDASASAAHDRIWRAVSHIRFDPVVVVVGGDNSLTRPALEGLMAARNETWGLLTLDAHHDVRPTTNGSSNGSPVRELIEAGLPGKRVAQVGIHPFGNQQELAAWAQEQGIHRFGIPEVRQRGAAAAVRLALERLSDAGAEHVYADLDVDVVDRAYAPACPASMPGGLNPDDFCSAAFELGCDSRVMAVDLCEVDANKDVNGITVRLMAQAFMSFCAGLTYRLSA